MDMHKVLLFLATVAIRHGCASSEKPLYFSLMVSSAASMNTTGVVDAVNDVLETINNSSTLLTSKKLLYTNGGPLDTQVCLHIHRIILQPVAKEGRVRLTHEQSICLHPRIL